MRSRLYFERVVEDGYEPDPDQRRLSTKKSNYGKTGNEILCRWDAGRFVTEDGGSFLDQKASNIKAQRVFLELLDAYTSEGRSVNAKGGINYAPNVFAKDKRAERISRSAFVEAMNDLFARRAIMVHDTSRPGRSSSHIVRVEE